MDCQKGKPAGPLIIRARLPARAIALRPDSMLAHLRLAETYHRLGNLDEAARELRLATNLDQTATRPFEELGDVLYLQELFDRAA